MTNGPFFPKTTAINFTVQNTSPQKKRISIFGYPIEYGFTRDLLAIPEITESIIRESLIKGELYDKISRKDIVVVSSTINLLQFDASQKAFLAGAGITIGLDNKIEINGILNSMGLTSGTSLTINVKDHGAIGNGIADDTTAIQSSINIANSTGYPIYFPPGTYLVSPPPIVGGNIFNITQNNLQIIGAGSNSSIIKASSSFTGGYNVFFITGTNVSISDLGFDSVTTTLSSRPIAFDSTSGGALRRCHIAAKFGWGAFIGGATDCLIEDYIVDGTTDAHGIEINHSHYTVLRRCYIHNTGIISNAGAGIEFYDAATGAQSTGNRILDCHITDTAVFGININGTIQSTIDNCVIERAGTYGLQIDCSELDHTRLCTDLTVSNSKFSAGGAGAGNAGINVGTNASTKGFRFLGNTVDTSGGTGIFLNWADGAVIAGNNIRNNYGHGIYVGSGATGSILNGNAITDNSVYSVGGSQGIIIYGTDTILCGNYISDTRGGAARQDRGIYIQTGSNQTKLIGNVVNGSKNYPWIVDSGTATEQIANLGNAQDRPTISGALSSVTDANAKAVLTSIISALTGMGFAISGTT